jgi:hypothetical protein
VRADRIRHRQVMMPNMRLEPPSPFADPRLRVPGTDFDLEMGSLAQGPFNSSVDLLRSCERPRADLQLPRPYSMPTTSAHSDYYGNVAFKDGFRAASAPRAYLDSLPLELSNLLHSETPTPLPHPRTHITASKNSMTICLASSQAFPLPQQALSLSKLPKR